MSIICNDKLTAQPWFGGLQEPVDWEFVMDLYKHVRNLRDKAMAFRVDNALGMVE